MATTAHGVGLSRTEPDARVSLLYIFSQINTIYIYIYIYYIDKEK